MSIQLISSPIAMADLAATPENRSFGLVKAVVDIEKKIMALGGELHADEEVLLLDRGSKQQDLWGINLYPDKTGDDLIEFDSMINLRPSFGNRSRGVDDPKIRERVVAIVRELVRIT